MKKSDKMLYEIWLDLSFAVDLSNDAISDMSIELKEMKKANRKAKRLLAKTTERYEKIYGKKPTRKKQ